MRFRDDMTVELIDHMGGDASVIAAARVSTRAARSKEDFLADPKENAGLINFLMKGRHGSPFEHNAMTFYVEAPIFVFREWHRHRIGFSYNEWSSRYSQLEPTFYLPNTQRNMQQIGKPGHYEFVPGTQEQYDDFIARNMIHSERAYNLYEDQLAKGIAKEVARMCLPVNIYSAMYVTLNARSCMAFLSLRTKREDSTFPSYPQREIEMCAEQVEGAFAQLFPLTYAAFNRNGRVCP